MTTNIYNKAGNAYDNNQSIYDSFNEFMFSNDRNVFNKLMARIDIYLESKHLFGDIVECGVYKGTGMLTWLKAMDAFEHHGIKKVVGFDMFDPKETINIIADDVDARMMQQVFSRDDTNSIDETTLTSVNSKLVKAGFDSSKFDLVKGDIGQTAIDYVDNRPGMRISILYLDMDIYEPTIAALNAFHRRIVPEGVIIFDEYAYQSWSESNAADEFLNLYGHAYEVRKFPFKAPTMMLVKK